MSYFKIKRDSNTPVELGVLVENVEGLDERLALKVDKVEGKGLSTNDYTATEKNNVASNTAARHSHGNKSVIDKITQALLDNWNVAFSHISDSVKHITASERTLWNTVSSKANKSDVLTKTNTTEYTPTSDYNPSTKKYVDDAIADKGVGNMLKSVYDINDNGVVDNAEKVNGLTVLTAVPANAKFTDTIYTHPTSSGNKHIPSGGASGQILKWSADGTAVWGSEKVYTHPNSGVTAGTYKSVTVNDQGHVTAGSNPTTLAGYGITDAASKTHSHTKSQITDFPTSLPANGGNADTVDKVHVNDSGSGNVLWTASRIQEELQSNLPTGVVHWTGTVTAGKEIEIVIPHTDDFKTCSVEILAQRNSIWEKAIHGIDYNYAIVDATHISIIFLLAGTFIANYAFCAQGHVQLIEVSNSEPASLKSGDFWYEVLS